MITITEEALHKITEVLADEPNTYLRMFVQGGGCAGFSYGFTLDDVKNDDDIVIPAGERSVLVDTMSAHYVAGAVVDYKDDLQGSRFSIDNPTATSTCGCGSSFSM